MSRSQVIKKWLFSGIALLTILALAGCAGGAATSTSATNITAVVQRGTLVNTINATGTVRPAQTATINWQTSGKVGQVSAKLGQTVKANDVLASLDPNTLSQSTIQAQIDLINAQQALANLQQPQPLQVAQAEANLATAQTNLNNLLNPTAVAIANAQAAVVTAQANETTAQNNYNYVTQGGRGTQLQIQTAQANLLLAQQALDNWQTQYNNISGDPTTDLRKASALSNLTNAQNNVQHAQDMLNWYLEPPDPATVAQRASDLAVAKATLADAQTKLDQLKNPTQSDIDLAKAQVTNAQTALDTAKAGPTADDLTVAQNKVTLAQLAVNASQLTAPFNGTITSVSVLPGDLVNNNTVAFQIDDMSKMLIDLSVLETDVHQIQVSQPVSVTFDAIPNKSYSGKVSQVGMVGTTSQGSVYFDVTVQLTNADSHVKSGMTAVADITVAQAKNVLEVPNRAVQSQGKNKYVTVIVNGAEQNVNVTVGLVSDTMSEVSSPNLKEGDQVLVVIPASTTTNRGGFGGGGFGGIITGGGR